jgi:hypothetical protein
LEGSSRESIGRALDLPEARRRALIIQAARSLLEPRRLPTELVEDCVFPSEPIAPTQEARVLPTINLSCLQTAGAPR